MLRDDAVSTDSHIMKSQMHTVIKTHLMSIFLKSASLGKCSVSRYESGLSHIAHSMQVYAKFGLVSQYIRTQMAE